MASRPGQAFGRYQVEAVLGQGGFATVYLAFDPALRRRVAIKVLHAQLATDPGIAARFQSEAQQLARLRHPHVVGVHDVGEQDGRPYFAMEVIEGKTLAALLRERGTLSVAEAVGLATQLGAALDYLHGMGIVHRDLKPSNVMVGVDGRVTLMDFGVARALDQPGMTATGGVLGTPMYMSPEQVRGQPAGPAADIYALAVLLYQCVGGRPPFEGETLAVLHAQASEAPPSLALLRPGLPPRLYQAIEGGLAKDAAARPRSAGQLAVQLAEAAGPAGPLTPQPITPISLTQTTLPTLPFGASAAPTQAYAAGGTPVPPTEAYGSPGAPLPATSLAPPGWHTPAGGAAQQTPADFAPTSLATPRTPVPPAQSPRRRSGRPFVLVGIAAAVIAIAALTAGVAAALSHRNSSGPKQADAVVNTAPPPAAPAAAAANAPAQQPAAAPPAAATRAAAAVATATRVAAQVQAPQPPAAAAAPPQPAVPAGDYRIVQNTGIDKCLRGRAAPGVGSQIYVCVADGFVVHLIDGPRPVDGFDWYNAEGIGWMAGTERASGTVYLRPYGGTPPPPATALAGCLVLDFTTQTSGVYRAPPSLSATLDKLNGAIVSTSGGLAGWLYGNTLFLKYSTTIDGAPATGTIVADVDQRGLVRGRFVATAFRDASNGAIGAISGQTQASCGR